MKNAMGRALIAAMALFSAGAMAADKGTVTSVLSRDSERYYAVNFISVDGENLPAGQSLLNLAPGKRRIGIVALIESSNAIKTISRRDRSPPRYVEIEVVAGKRYRVGAKVSDVVNQTWAPVIEYR